ncbi:MAG: hypothetical protein IPI16_17510 [Comamonadaceae bacterium]|nr:hypothetical protein [Comamonadaceae bacterium]
MTMEIDIDLEKDFVDTVVEEITPEECEASECASHSDNRLVYFTAGDGTIQIHRRHSGERLDLCPAEARELYLWLANSGIWSLK